MLALLRGALDDELARAALWMTDGERDRERHWEGDSTRIGIVQRFASPPREGAQVRDQRLALAAARREGVNPLADGIEQGVEVGQLSMRGWWWQPNAQVQLRRDLIKAEAEPRHTIAPTSAATLR